MIEKALHHHGITMVEKQQIPNSRALLPTFHAFCPDGLSFWSLFVQMGSLVYIIEDDYTTEMIVYHYKELF